MSVKRYLRHGNYFFLINKQRQKRMKSVSLRSIRAKYGCLKQTSVLTNAFAAISRVSSFASTFVWTHGILASSIHITSVIVSCAFLNFWKKSRRFINSHLLWLMTLLRTVIFWNDILNLNSWKSLKKKKEITVNCTKQVKARVERLKRPPKENAKILFNDTERSK